MSYIGNEPIVSATRTTTEIVATAGQTVFTANGGYTPGYLDVYVNGAQLQSSDFTATNGASATLAQACFAGDDVKLIAWGVFNATNVTGSSIIDGTITQAKLASNVVGNGVAFYAFASTSTNMGSDTQTTVNFQTELYDTNNNFNTTNSRFTPTVAGYYLISSTIRYDAPGNVVTHLYIGHSRLGTIGTGNFFAGSSGQTASSGTTITYMNGTTDYVTASLYVNVGGNNIVTGQGNSYFTGCLIRAA